MLGENRAGDELPVCVRLFMDGTGIADAGFEEALGIFERLADGGIGLILMKVKDTHTPDPFAVVLLVHADNEILEYLSVRMGVLRLRDGLRVFVTEEVLIGIEHQMILRTVLFRQLQGIVPSRSEIIDPLEMADVRRLSKFFSGLFDDFDGFIGGAGIDDHERIDKIRRCQEAPADRTFFIFNNHRKVNFHCSNFIASRLSFNSGRSSCMICQTSFKLTPS